MKIWNIAQKFAEIDQRLDQFDSRLGAVEHQAAAALDSVGDYKRRTRQELVQMNGKVEAIVEILESLIGNAENKADEPRARALLKRARNNQTRIRRQLEAS